MFICKKWSGTRGNEKSPRYGYIQDPSITLSHTSWDNIELSTGARNFPKFDAANITFSLYKQWLHEEDGKERAAKQSNEMAIDVSKFLKFAGGPPVTWLQQYRPCKDPIDRSLLFIDNAAQASYVSAELHSTQKLSKGLHGNLLHDIRSLNKMCLFYNTQTRTMILESKHCTRRKCMLRNWVKMQRGYYSLMSRQRGYYSQMSWQRVYYEIWAWNSS